jgi:hypothetical protein
MQRKTKGRGVDDLAPARWCALVASLFIITIMRSYVTKGLFRSHRLEAGHSGYPKISGRVIRVVRNSGIENCYSIFAPKKHYLKFRVPDNSGSGSCFTRYTRN